MFRRCRFSGKDCSSLQERGMDTNHKLSRRDFLHVSAMVAVSTVAAACPGSTSTPQSAGTTGPAGGAAGTTAAEGATGTTSAPPAASASTVGAVQMTTTQP